MEGVDETKQAECRECGKPFQAKIEYYIPLRGKSAGKKIARWFGWCSKRCYRKYYKSVRV